MFLFYLTNYIAIPYRWTWIDYFYRKLREFISRKLFLFVGKEVVIRPNLRVSYLSKISIGDYSSLGDRSLIVADGGISIGEDVMMGPEVMIYSKNHEITSPREKLINGNILFEKVTIEDDVWIGARAIILPGATISKGSVVAAGAVVPGKVFPQNAVIGGNPAKVIKYRS